MANLNVVTLFRSHRTFDESFLSLWDSLSPAPNPQLNHKVLCDTKLDADCLKGTIKWAQEERKPTRVDPLFKHLVSEARTQIKTFEVKVWCWKNTPFLMAFTDSRVKLHEVQDGLRELFGGPVSRVDLPHATLHSLLSSETVLNVYELEFKDANESSGVSTITVSGHSLQDSDLFNQLVNRGQYLARLKVELTDDKGITFLATASTSGLILLSPYVAESQVKAFIHTLIPLLPVGPA